jgi:predicted metal-dependent hydrolase
MRNMAQVTHSIQIGGREISYILKASPRRRTVGMRIDRNGLTVSIPSRMARRDVPEMLLRHASWIEKKLEQLITTPPEMQWEDSARLLYLGRELTLETQSGGVRSPVILNGECLTVAVPDPADAIAIRRKVMAWYRLVALEDFTRRIAIVAAKLGVATPPLSLSNAATRWGSCSGRGDIRLNWRLIQAPPPIIHYVVAHELAHLKHMDHSRKFWTVVETLCPDYINIRKQLKTLSTKLHTIQ